MSVEECTSIELICSGLNTQGFAMLRHVQCDGTVGHIVYLDEWIECLQLRYEYFFAHAKTHDIDAVCPELPEF